MKPLIDSIPAIGASNPSPLKLVPRSPRIPALATPTKVLKLFGMMHRLSRGERNEKDGPRNVVELDKTEYESFKPSFAKRPRLKRWVEANLRVDWRREDDGGGMCIVRSPTTMLDTFRDQLKNAI